MALSFGSIISMRLGVYNPFVFVRRHIIKRKTLSLSLCISRTRTLMRRFTDASFFLSIPFSSVHVQNSKPEKKTNERKIFFLLFLPAIGNRERTFYFLCGKIGQLTLQKRAIFIFEQFITKTNAASPIFFSTRASIPFLKMGLRWKIDA